MKPPPPPWSTGDAGSFAHRTLAVRVPRILDDTVAQNPGFDDDIRRRCRVLRDELTGGRLRGLAGDDGSTPFDQAQWAHEAAPYVGRTWLAVPWYFAEAYFYRRLLEAVRYFTTSLDPFLAVKREEERAAFPKAQALLSSSSSPQGLLAASLWGNRADLSYTAGLAHGAVGSAADLLVDDTDAAALALHHAASVGILLDNAGTELAFDLVLADSLRNDVVDGARTRVTLFAKQHPFFVSDATPADVERTRVALGLAPFDVVAHPFMTSSGLLRRTAVHEGDVVMPPDLVRTLGGFDVVISKGDANYRRLVGDAPWPHDTAFDDAIDFPSRVLALRTLKAEVAVGIAKAPTDSDWLVSGRFGVIQLSRG